jgi:hypothetical protein
LPQVLRNNEPLNPDRRPGWDGRSGDTAGKRRGAAVICHAATPRGRAPERTRAWTAEHILRGQFNRNRSLSLANYLRCWIVPGEGSESQGRLSYLRVRPEPAQFEAYFDIYPLKP